jgi:DNA mismatch endonuclease (patch repair protein)
MSQIKSGDTAVEKTFRKHLWKMGLRGYRTHCKITGRPDLYFPRKKIAVFIDGCFWHKCPKCYKKPKSNIKFWCNKVKTNKKRDKIVNRTLKKNGVKVLRFWEHQAKNNLESCFNRIKRYYGKK